MGLKTLNEMLRNSVNLYCNETAFKIKKDEKFIPITYLELYHKVEEFGTGLLAIGIKSFDHIGLINNNRFEWIVANLAIIGLRAVDVPCNGNSSSQDIRFKLNHSDCSSVILEGEKQFSNFYDVIEYLPNIKNVILMDETDVPYNSDKCYYSFQEILKIGEKSLLEGDTSFSEISKTALPEDLVTIIYTSGTTADPKGVMLTNSNLMHTIRTTPQRFGLCKKDRFLAIFPPWHIGERCIEYVVLSTGASIAYSKPFKQVLLPDLKIEKPTFFICVPLLWEGFYKGVINNIKKGNIFQRTIFNWAIRIGEEYKKAEGIINNTMPLFDRMEYTSEELNKAQRTVKKLGWKYKLANELVFRKIRKVFGGKLRFTISGGAKLPEDTCIFFNIVGIKIYEGYGLTEAATISV